VEGFIRQIIGWREFVQLLYRKINVQQRTTNYWGFTNEMPAAFYDGSTGLAPIDQSIRKLLKTGYNHHIERLMVLGNFMLLCEIKPDAVYRWFMEMYIDAYDWVMVPNVYGMGQSASDIMMTRIYFSSSNYILKMSNFKKGDWVKTWDAVYYSFIKKHYKLLSSNYATAMQAKHYTNKTNEEKDNIDTIAKQYSKTILEKN
jgi:deoxyribodipyrimidine photolyase-related protein